MVNSGKMSAIGAAVAILLSGCGLRYAATEAQKQNAWVHAKVCSAAAYTATDEGASGQLCGLTSLAAEQSEAFVLDYGLPEQMHGQAELERGTRLSDDEVEALLADGSAIAEAARVDSMERPDVWSVADGAMDLGIALAGLLGGVYGVRAAGFLQQARDKARALKEIVAGNELFKQLYPEQAERFKEAQAKQSATTRTIVTELK